MCILFVAYQVHPDYPLIVCANRDEFHHRPTQGLHLWQQPQGIIAGKDLEAGGTWLGVNQQGEFAALTNIRAPELQQQDMRSRGDLVLNALDSQQPFDQLWLTQHSEQYNPFNLVFEQHDQLMCYNSVSQTSSPLSRGFHAISNGELDDVWPKMAKGTQALEDYVSGLLRDNSAPKMQQLAMLMKDESRAADADLPQTGVALEWERLLSAIYIKHPEYGTRATSIVLRNAKQQVDIMELRYDGKGRQLGSDVLHVSG
ncbi:NRDE family protein [Shewanella sp. Scap07]|uniref:NRDE family protein n=1 Tax=Shewanella sp. Scap07 TaxID=2589987 RepID=UPI0015BB67A1|nr:NRDE family protein [Shewanella sp. Scap07]QLE83734.1 NRDE family protein [Shewanella sp. Scap07]